jgi:hypothetical protein
VSERRANLEKDDVQADPIVERGRVGKMSEEYAHLLHRRSDGSM